MKKYLSILVVLLMVVSLSACGKKVTPKDALTNNTEAKQGNMMMALNLSTNTGNGPEELNMLVNSIFGASEDNKKVGVESTITAKYQGKALEGKIDVNADLTGNEPKVSLEAGVPESTLANFGTGMPTAIVVTLNEDDFSKLMKQENINLNDTINADSLKKNAESLQKILQAFSDLKIEEPKDAGSGSATIGGKTFEGEKYTAHITSDQVKGVIKALVKIGSDMEKAETKSSTAQSKLNIPSEKDINTQIDQMFKDINFKDGIDATMIVDKDGYLSYMGAEAGIKDPAGASEVKLNLSIGYLDLSSSVKGLDYYNKNKTGMYKNATVIPIMQYLQGDGKTGQNGSAASSLFGLGNKQ